MSKCSTEPNWGCSLEWVRKPGGGSYIFFSRETKDTWYMIAIMMCLSYTGMRALTMGWRKLVANLRDCTPAHKFRKVVTVAFSDKYLFYTNVTISLSLSAMGDVAEQNYELYCKELENYDPRRTFHMACSGVAVGVLCHHWYKVLDRFIIGKTFDMVVKKLVLDQFIFSPIMIVTFFGSLALFEENPIENFKDEIKGKFVTLYQAEWVVWPPAQIINFYFLPTRYRVLYDNTISLGYDVFTSQVKHGKGKKVFLDRNDKKDLP